jgi:hypothetical protein
MIKRPIAPPKNEKPETTVVEGSEKGVPIPVHLRSVGEAPSLKKSKFKIDGLKAILEVLPI